jgi:hypothetical protein
MQRRDRRAFRSASLILVIMSVIGAIASPSNAADVLPTPHDDAHLIIVHPTGWTNARGERADSRAQPGAVFETGGVVIAEPVKVRFTARNSGNYTLWVRVGQKEGARSPLIAEIVDGDKTILTGPLNHDGGQPGSGGAKGYLDYRERAIRNTPHNVVGDPSLIQLRDLSSVRKGDANKKDDDLTNDVLHDMRSGTGENWAVTSRVDLVNKAFPLYWWKIGAVKLESGEYELRLHSQDPVAAATAPVVDAAILTTYDKLIYPYGGDINAPRASYIRFRLDKIPAEGLQISGFVNNHVYPYFRTVGFHLNPSGLSELKLEKHTSTGFTRWYCLQDVKRMVAITGHEVTLHILDPQTVKSKKLRCATQFAVFPHQDAVVRSIGWDEPDGTFISMSPDFEANQHQLRTVRDHAREHYDRALVASEGHPHLLARPGDLSLTNYSATALGEDYDYMVKSMRLLGFNTVGIRDPLKSRKNYGGANTAGIAALAAYVPFDEAESRRQYDKYFGDLFKNVDVETYKGIDVYQIADEPSEAYRTEMTAPLWRYNTAPQTVTVKGKGPKHQVAGGQWVDLCGSSELNTRRTDLSNCVLEGKITKLGLSVGFRVAIDNADEPKHYAFWNIGKVGPNGTPENVAAGQVGLPGETRYPFYSLRPLAVFKLDAPTPFKIVYEGTRAAIYINGELAHEHKGLPTKGGFGFWGPPKSISELLIRPIRKGEHIAPDVQVGEEFVERPKPGAEDPVLDDPDAASKTPPKPLKEFVEQEWVPAGGIPGARAGFRKWAAAKGLTPEFFGQKSWHDVNMLTVKELVRDPQEARLYYWSRRYSGFLTPHMFRIAADSVRAFAPNKNMIAFVGLSGHTHYFPGEMPMDMFELGNQGYPLMPGISDWMSLGGWRWDSHQSVAYSVAPFNTGARRWNADGTLARPVSFPMMHCVFPNLIRSYTMLANQVKYMSYYTFGPYYAIPGDYWSEMPECYQATSLTANRAGQVDDVLTNGIARQSRVALLYAHATEYWDSQSAYSDRRAAFLGLSHEYFQPELITEDQIIAGDLKHYDALFVMDPYVAAAAQKTIAAWVQGGGLLHASADAMTHNEFNEPFDGLAALAAIKREYPASAAQIPLRPSLDPKIPATGPMFVPIQGEIDFRPHTVTPPGIPLSIKAEGARIRAKYDTGMAAWIERAVGKGKVVYIAHRCGLTYTAKASRPGGYHDIWADTGRASLTLPLLEAKVRRELVLSEPSVMAAPLETENGTVIILYNMRPSPLKKLGIELLEPAKPLNVQAFEGLKLVDVPFEYGDGRVRLTLPVLDGAQMVLVRRKAAAPDGRLEEIHQRTLAQLKSKDKDDLSAGAWFAGFYPQWKLADQVLPLLGHPRWEVRRAAAEALGRLGRAAAAEPLLSALHAEKDSNALCDELLALARLHHPAVPALAVELLNREDPIIRQFAARSEETWLALPADVRSIPEIDALARERGLQIARRALADPNLRVRREGIALIVRLDPAKAVDAAIAAFADTGVRGKQDRPEWVAALSANDAAFNEFVRRGMPGGDAMLIDLASTRAHPALARAIASRLLELDSAFPGKLGAVAICQSDSGLAAKMLELQNKLSPKSAPYVAHALEHAYDARLGSVLPDWEKWVKDHSRSARAMPRKP